jgi:hypothetical protein
MTKQRASCIPHTASSFTVVVIVIAWPHLMSDERALKTKSERTGTGKTTAQDIVLNVPGRNSRLLAAILLLYNGILANILILHTLGNSLTCIPHDKKT